MILGAHLSIAKGLPKAVEMAREIGANTFQFFTRNPRGGSAREISPEEIDQWLQLRQEFHLFPIVGHLPYTVNPAAPKPETHEFARTCLYEDLRRAAAFGAEYLVVHPGSHVGAGVAEAIGRIAEAFRYALEGFEGQTRLLLETMSGQGTEVGARVEELGAILRQIGEVGSSMGVCLDTCHLFASGYDLRLRTEVDRLVADLEEHVGMERVFVLHLNDSKTECGSRRDRHEKLGRGKLGREGLVQVLTHPALQGLPVVLETPVKDYREYKEELELVREWLG